MSANLLSAQLPFAGPANRPAARGSQPMAIHPLQATALPASDGLDELADAVATAQFQPMGEGGSGAISPEVPSPANEASLSSGDPIPAPPAESIGAPAVEPEAAPMDFSDALISGPELGVPYDQAYVDDVGAEIFSTNTLFRRGVWYTQEDVVLLTRAALRNVVIAADQSFRSGTQGANDIGMVNRPMLYSDQVAPNFRPGVRLTIGRLLGQDVANRDHAIELNFLGLFDYSGRARLGVTNLNSTLDNPGLIDSAIVQGAGLVFPSGVQNSTFPAFSNAVDQEIFYASDLNSTDLNFRMMGRPLRDKLALQPNGSWVRHGANSQVRSFLLGMRYISINELFRYDSLAEAGDLPTRGTYQVQTSNDMWGGQVGFEVMENYTSWSVGLRMKTGALYNFANRRSKLHYFQVGEETLRREDINQQTLSPFVELGAIASYQIRPNFIIHAGYEGLFVNSIANAVENAFIADNFADFETSNSALYHGASFGCEMLW